MQLFIFVLEGKEMRIEDIVKEKQPKSYKKMKKIMHGKLSKRDIEELMYHPSYKRGSRGAIKQVR